MLHFFIRNVILRLEVSWQRTRVTISWAVFYNNGQKKNSKCLKWQCSCKDRIVNNLQIRGTYWLKEYNWRDSNIYPLQFSRKNAKKGTSKWVKWSHHYHTYKRTLTRTNRKWNSLVAKAGPNVGNTIRRQNKKRILNQLSKLLQTSRYYSRCYEKYHYTFKLIQHMLCN